MVIMIVLAILVFLWQRNRVEAAERDIAKFKDQSREADLENAQKTIASPGIPTTKAEAPQGPRDPEDFCESYDDVQPPLSGAMSNQPKVKCPTHLDASGSSTSEVNDLLSTESVSIEMEGVNEMDGSMGNSRNLHVVLKDQM